MRQITPRAFHIAQSVLEQELRTGQEPEDIASAAESVCHQLYGQLAKLIGHEGFYSLLARALYLSKVEFSFLHGVERSLEEEACLRGLRESVMSKDFAEAKEGMLAVVANFISLLVVFIGEDITLRQVRKIWPEASPGNTNSVSEEAKE